MLGRSVRSLFVSFWPAWSSMLWCENSQAVHSIGSVHMPITSTAWKRISKATRAALHSTELCRCLREFFWCWIQLERLSPREGGAAMTWHGCAGINPISGCTTPDDKYLPGRGVLLPPRLCHGAQREPGTSRPVVFTLAPRQR